MNKVRTSKMATWLTRHPTVLSTLAAGFLAIAFIQTTNGIQTGINPDKYGFTIMTFDD